MIAEDYTKTAAENLNTKLNPTNSMLSTEPYSKIPSETTVNWSAQAYSGTQNYPTDYQTQMPQTYQNPPNPVVAKYWS